MKMLNRTERFKEVSRKLMTFVIKDKEVDPFSGVHQISFRLPNIESDSFNVFEYSRRKEFIEDLQSLDLSSSFDKICESANRILNGLGIDESSSFALEMY